jgi:surface-anchored protein
MVKTLPNRSNPMRVQILNLLCVALLPCWAQAQDLLTAHTDIKFSYNTGTGEWEAVYNHGGTPENPNTETPFDQGSLPAEDQATPSGDRYTQPGSSSFDFTGVPDGEPLWILPATDRGYTWPGFRNDQTPGTFRAYNPGDSRVTSDPLPWVEISLQEVIYSGHSTGTPTFSAWEFQGGPIVWMSSDDGIGPDDVYFLEQNGHTHINFGFSDLGIYRVGFKAKATLDSSGQVVESNAEYATFAIGTLATWLADHFGGVDLVTPSVTGMSADTDKDQVEMLHEYAFNMDPTQNDRHYLERDTGTSGLPIGWIEESQGEDRLHLQFVQRRTDTNPQIRYLVQFNDTLSETGWETGFNHQTAVLDGEWERVTVVDTESTATASSRFARVQVVVDETINY